MMAAAAMLFTSCSQEEFNFSTAEKANVAINLSTPQIASRAYSDGKSANHLQYAVYDVTDVTPVLITEFTKTNETIDLRKTVNFQLANGRTYNLVFWAASSNADEQYAVNFGTDKAEMTVNYGDFFKANCEDLDAFYACQQVKVNGSAVVDVKMYRPFAQINVGTDDYAAAAVAGCKPTLSSVTVDNVFSNLDLMTGAVTGEQSYTFTNNAIAAPYDEETGTGEKFPVDGYDYLAMAYALVDAEQALTTVTFTHTGGSVTEEITVGSVPVQRNYRTNLYGSILTSGIVANVEIVPAYEEPDNNIPVEGYSYNEATKTYTVYSADGLKKVYNTQPIGATYTVELAQNIDLGGATWTPINNKSTVFDGKNYTISNFVVDQTKNGAANAGFFGSGMGTIKNVTFDKADVKGNYKVGVAAGDGLCVHLINVKVTNSKATSTPWLKDGVKYDDGNNCGGIVGYFSAEGNGEIVNCSVEGSTIKAYRKVGGIAGYVGSYESSTGDITGNTVSNTDVIADMLETNYDGYPKAAEASEIFGSMNYKGKGNVSNNNFTDVNVSVLQIVDNKIEVSTPGALASIADMVNNGNTFKGVTIQLEKDIDLGNESWTPIGTNGKPFNGIFDGNNKTISNLNVDMPGKSYAGLFGYTPSATIKNLTIENVNIVARLYVGAVAGNPYTGTFSDITVKGDIKIEGMSYVGGVTGYNAYGNYTNITVNANKGSYVKANSIENGTRYHTYVGGVVGFPGEGNHSFVNVNSNIDVYGNVDGIGGLTGMANYGIKFENCTVTGNVYNTGAQNLVDAGGTAGIAGIWNQTNTDVSFKGCKFTGKLECSLLDEEKIANQNIVGMAWSTAEPKGRLYIEDVDVTESHLRY